MIETSRITPDLSAFNKMLPRLRMFVLAAGLAIHPGAAMSQRVIPPEASTESIDDTSTPETGDQHRDSLRALRSFDRTWKGLLENNQKGRHLLELEERITRTVRDIANNSAVCKERTPPVWERDFEDAAKHITDLLSRETQFKFILRSLAFFSDQDLPSEEPVEEGSAESTPQIPDGYDYSDMYDDSAGERGDGDGGRRLSEHDDESVEEILKTHYPEMRLRGEALLSDLEDYSQQVENSPALQRALKYVFDKSGCPMS